MLLAKDMVILPPDTTTGFVNEVVIDEISCAAPLINMTIGHPLMVSGAEEMEDTETWTVGDPCEASTTPFVTVPRVLGPTNRVCN